MYSSSHHKEMEEDLDRLKDQLKQILVELRENPLAKPFNGPIDEAKAPPGYLTIVKYPMGMRHVWLLTRCSHIVLFIDFQTVWDRVLSGYYVTLRLFIADVKRIFDNSRLYYEKGTDVYKHACQLEKLFITKMKTSRLWYDIAIS